MDLREYTTPPSAGQARRFGCLGLLARLTPALLACTALLSGCDKLGMGGPSSADLKLEAEGRAIGGGCRHAGKSIEECYAANRKAEKAAVYAGWREMNDYMAQKGMGAPAQPGASAASGAGGSGTPGN
jgi:hypothetical protein